MKADRLRGAAAIAEMLDMIGDGTDHQLALVFTEHELVIRRLLEYGLRQLASEPS